MGSYAQINIDKSRKNFKNGEKTSKIMTLWHVKYCGV